MAKDNEVIYEVNSSETSITMTNVSDADKELTFLINY